MNKCHENSDCNQMVGDRVLHGFSVKREKDKFVIEMPFGKNGIGKSFNVSDNNAGRFYINFGNSENSMRTYVIPGDISDLPAGSDPKRRMVIDANNENAIKNFKSNMDEGMPLEIAQHLWMLGIDLLGTVEQQKLHFFTKGEPRTKEIISCKKNDENLRVHEEHLEKFINVMYFMPSADDIRKLENMHEERKSEAKPAPKHLIIVGEADHEHNEKLPNPLPNIEFFLSGWLPENAAKFSILLYHGTKQLVEEFGQKVMEIVVAFDGKNIKECTVTSFLSEKMTPESCNNKDPKKAAAFTQGKKFWFWVKIHNGKMEISMNCNELTFTIGILPYSPENYIQFSGDLDLVIYDKRENAQVSTEIKSPNSNLTGKSPALLVKKMDDNLNMSKIIVIEAKSEIMDENNHGQNKKIVIRFAKTKMQNLTTNIVFEIENCKPENKSQCEGKNCINVKFSENKENKPLPQICLDPSGNETSFNFFILCDKPTNEKILGQAFLNMEKVLDVPAIMCLSDYLQIKGDLEYPIKANQFEIVYKYSAIAPTYSYTPTILLDLNNYVILHLLWLGKLANNDKKVIIQFICNDNECKKLPEKKMVLLELEINFENMMLKATTKKIRFEVNPKEGMVTYHNEIMGNELINIALKNSFWLKIKKVINQNDLFFEIYQDGTNIMEIKQLNFTHGTLPTSTDEFNIHGSISLLNIPYVFPHRFLFKKDNNKEMAENDTVIMKWRIMENAELVEFFVVKGVVKKLGTEKQDKFDNEGENEKLFLHIRAEKGVKNGTICISTALIKNMNCAQEGEIPIELFNPNAFFKLDNLHELKITFDSNEYATIQIDNNIVKKQANGNKFLEAEGLVLCHPPKIETNEKSTEGSNKRRTQSDPPKVNK